jgi:CBS domain containing-hemolysin-like protein
VVGTRPRLSVLLDPNGAVLGVFFFPDGNDRLELVDRGPCRGECGVAVRSRRGDDDRDVADGKVADPVVHSDPKGAVLAHEAVGDLAHLGLRHLGVGLVLEMEDALASASAAHGAEEHHDATERVVANERKRVVDGERRLADRDRRHGACISARNRGYQGQLVSVGERLVNANVLTVARDDDLASLGDERVLIRDACDGVAHGRTGRQLQTEVSSARRLTIRGEQTHQHAHAMSVNGRLCRPHRRCENRTFMDPSALVAVGLTLALVLANGFFVAAEYAFVRIRKTQLDELAQQGSARARLSASIVGKLDQYISASQLGVTLCSLAIGWIGEPAVARLLGPLFTWLPDPLLEVLSFALAFGVITYLHIVVGELAPKYLAIQRALTLALWCAYPLDLFYRVMYPFIALVNGSANAILRVAGIRPNDEVNVHSEEELKMLVAVSTRKGVLQESERVIVGRAMEFADRIVRQVMVPRTEIVAVSDDTPVADILITARQHRFSRFPVYQDDLDHIIGIVHVKDLVGVDKENRTRARDVMRKVPVMPETMRLDQALAEFRRQRVQLAVVLDEFGGTAGLVTLEDVIEQLVGEVHDEFDSEAPAFKEEGPGTFVVDGLTSLDALRERLGVELTDEPYDTVGGLVFGRLGRLAAIGDTIEIEGYRFQVTAVDGRRVAQVRVVRARPPRKAA